MTAVSDARILFIATNGFEQDELFGPRQTLLDAGATVVLASLDTDEIEGEKDDEPARSITPDTTVDAVDATDFDGLVLPGGTKNPDTLRMNADVVKLIQAFDAAQKPIAAICHGPWLLAEANVIRGKRVTSWPSIRTDLTNAGAEVVDHEAVTDGNIVTSRNPGDVPAFTQAFIAALAEVKEEADA